MWETSTCMHQGLLTLNPSCFLYFFTVTRTAVAVQGDKWFSAKSIAHDLLLESLKAESKQLLARSR